MNIKWDTRKKNEQETQKKENWKKNEIKSSQIKCRFFFYFFALTLTTWQVKNQKVESELEKSNPIIFAMFS